MQESLAPTAETLEQVSSNPALLAAFDDPQIMAAVAEIARDPCAFSKHKSNQKVNSTAFVKFWHLPSKSYFEEGPLSFVLPFFIVLRSGKTYGKENRTLQHFWVGYNKKASACNLTVVKREGKGVGERLR